MRATPNRRFQVPDDAVTPRGVFEQRRKLLKAMGFAGLAAAGWPLTACASAGPSGGVEATLKGLQTLKATPDPRFTTQRPLTTRDTAASYNNYYEFTQQKDAWKYVENFQPKPWQIEIGGLVEKPYVLDVYAYREQAKLEERRCRFRCVEAWAMVVPWIGVPLRRVLEEARPLPQARYLRFVSFMRPSQAPTQAKDTWLSKYWPYFEGLTLPEAMNDAAFLAFGIYGHELPVQHGAPVRMVLPWKYGYKGPKGIVRMELTDEQPQTFWNTLFPQEYSFWSNVNPNKPHPRWSQASERMLGTNERVPTLLYNGYGEFVDPLYGDMQPSDPGYGFGGQA